jgi:hypothetical protein
MAMRTLTGVAVSYLLLCFLSVPHSLLAAPAGVEQQAQNMQTRVERPAANILPPLPGPERRPLPEAGALLLVGSVLIGLAAAVRKTA